MAWRARQNLGMPSDAPVHRYRTQVTWQGSTGAGYDRYERTHHATTVPSTVDLELASDPAFKGDATKLNPEELLVLAATSCQLLSFLAIAARARVDVVAYRDDGEGEMPEDEKPVRITRITLRPHITVRLATDRRDVQERSRIERLVSLGHQECYIANSLRAEVVVVPTIVFIDASAPLP
jgi:organic hydroperoxide reductase OsmC/OhrA